MLNDLGTLWKRKFLVKLWVATFSYIPCKLLSAAYTANQFVRIGDTAAFSLRKILKRTFSNWGWVQTIRKSSSIGYSFLSLSLETLRNKKCLMNLTVVYLQKYVN